MKTTITQDIDINGRPILKVMLPSGKTTFIHPDLVRDTNKLAAIIDAVWELNTRECYLLSEILEDR